MKPSEKPLALMLADAIDRNSAMNWPDFKAVDAAAELRRLHAENEDHCATVRRTVEVLVQAGMIHDREHIAEGVARLHARVQELESAPAPVAPASVWAVENRVAITLFSARDLAEAFVSQHTATAGLDIRRLDVIGAAPAPVAPAPSELPPLPEACNSNRRYGNAGFHDRMGPVYSPDQMRAYARAAIEAATKEGGAA